MILSRYCIRLLLPLLLLVSMTGCPSNTDPTEVIEEDIGTMPVDGDWTENGGFEENELPNDRSGFPSMPVAGVTYAPVYFGYDSFSIASSEAGKVQQVGQYLMSNPRHAVIVQGHTDERGSREYNLALGERRALAVREMLMTMGVSSDRIQTLSFGEEQPAVMGLDESAYSMNRRAEFKLMQ